MAATISDVARLANVSKKTVSRVINGEKIVTESTRQKVLEAIEQLNYVPSIQAVSLAKGRANCIGMLVPSLTWPVILDILRGVTDIVEISDYALMLYSMTRSEDSIRNFAYRMVRAKQIDGLIVLTPPGMFDYLVELHDKGLPMVLIDDRGYNPTFPSVATTNFEGGYAATQHLIEMGYRRIAFLNGPQNFGCNRDRLAGYSKALQDFGLDNDPALIYEDGDFTDIGDRGGIVATKSLLAAGVDFDAVFAANDIMAFGAMLALTQAGLRIPDDVAVVGFDDIPATTYTIPSLTTIRQPFYEMGQTAAQMLIDGLNGSPLPNTPIEMPTTLVIRDSSRPRR